MLGVLEDEEIMAFEAETVGGVRRGRRERVFRVRTNFDFPVIEDFR